MVLFGANFEITKLKKNERGEVVALAINHQDITLNTVALKCFKYSSSYLYLNGDIPTEDTEAVKVYTGGAIDDVEADYNAQTKTDCWTYDSKYFSEDMAQLEGAPKGTAGTPAALGNYIWATNKKFYKKVTVSEEDSYYEVTAFGKTAETMVISETAVSDVTLLTELEAATPKALAYVLYTLNAGFTYNAHHYERYATGDVTIE
jgi:hypothetical protein